MMEPEPGVWTVPCLLPPFGVSHPVGRCVARLSPGSVSPDSLTVPGAEVAPRGIVIGEPPVNRVPYKDRGCYVAVDSWLWAICPQAVVASIVSAPGFSHARFDARATVPRLRSPMR